jgi:hypothetical protein
MMNLMEQNLGKTKEQSIYYLQLLYTIMRINRLHNHIRSDPILPFYTF